MIDLYNRMKGAAAAVASQIGQPCWGTVSSVRNTDSGYEVKVDYQPWSTGAAQPITSGWLPVLSPSVGPGWGLVCPPAQGQQAFVIPENGDGEHGIVVGLAFSTQNMPPQPPNAFGGDAVPVTPQEFAIVSPKGAVLRFCADGTVYVKADVNIEGNLTVQGDIKAIAGAHGNGDVYDRHGSLDRLRGHYDAHQHDKVQNGGGVSGFTTQPDPE